MIGVFDSGVGGLTVLKGFLKDHPNYDYIYLGDNANVPYGNKSSDIIYGYSTKAIDFLHEQGCKLIIIACNSASAQALRKIQQEYLPTKYPNLKVLGVIRPIAEEVVSHKKIKKVGIIGTKATINSNIYQEEISALNSNLEILQKATPLLVPLIEENWLKKPETKMILKKYLRFFKMKQVEALVLACTHYPFLLKDIKKIMGRKCLVFDTEKIISDRFFDYLNRHPELGIEKNDKAVYKFYTTDNIEKFKELGEFFLERKILKIEKVSLK
ncbi:glutamate racemase [Candidatus Falkowbacteria bacterium HGW-Falkowbacteria-1]|uniref:Glutamate racemase n=1 Tax=Candidatus Falkowbacteria bacterium HGW-Falkowbacteria-1 TaxID=2013768 RepID=A0A2N2E9E2_9BACT|nr:MAG: glutamate racemase [Candidatus Falkowbacteria bacterium HGW-Falkowbacteria-1]